MDCCLIPLVVIYIGRKVAEGILLASYDFKIGEPRTGRKTPLGTLHVVTEDSLALERGAVFAHSTAFGLSGIK